MLIRALRRTDDRTTFRCGDADLDRFFAKFAGRNQFRHHIGVTYVAFDGERVPGYATVAAATLEGESITASTRKKLPGYPLPVLRLARLAVDASARDRGVGRSLLRHVFVLAIDMADRYGCAGVAVDAKPDAEGFYARFGFSDVELVSGALGSRPMPRAMFLPLDLIVASAPRA